MPWYSHISHFFIKQWGVISYLLIFVIAISSFIYIQSIDTFPDPDSFYHVRMSQEIAEQGVITQFPWLQASVLKESYINQHFLYHVFLIPFTHLMDPIQGAKLAQVFLNTGFIMLFYGLLRRHKVKFAFVLTMILLAATPFTFRLNLVKAPVVSLLFLVGSLYAMFRHRFLALFFIAFAYVWAYGGFILVLIASGSYAVMGVLMDWFYYKKKAALSVVLRYSKELRTFIVALAGVAAGLIINPHFPQNLIFYWRQLVQIGIVNFQEIIGVGQEWYPFAFVDLAAEPALVTVLVLIALATLLTMRRVPSKRVLTLFVLYIFFFAFTLKSHRYIEYYVPMAVLFVAFVYSHYLEKISWRRIGQTFFGFYRRYPIALTFVIAYVLVLAPAIIVKDAQKLNRDYQGAIPTDRFAAAGGWLADNAQPGDVVFHSSWDEFPMLFYYSPEAYYIIGLDPTFTYIYDESLHTKIVDITTGKQQTNVFEDIYGTFHAQYVFVESNHDAMEATISRTAGFYPVYQDSEATIYQVNPAQAL